MQVFFREYSKFFCSKNKCPYFSECSHSSVGDLNSRTVLLSKQTTLVNKPKTWNETDKEQFSQLTINKSVVNVEVGHVV